MRKPQKPSELGFTYHDQRRLKQALSHSTGARLFRRIQAVLLIADGRPIKEVAEITSSSQRSVYQWIHEYLLEHRVDSLLDLPRSGRPLVAKTLTDGRIKRELSVIHFR